MSVNIGEVETFPNVQADKMQALKVLEEAAEVFGAWQHVAGCFGCDVCDARPICSPRRSLLDECADVIQATCNLLAAIGVDDFTAEMERCKERNAERGRM